MAQVKFDLTKVYIYIYIYISVLVCLLKMLITCNISTIVQSIL